MIRAICYLPSREFVVLARFVHTLTLLAFAAHAAFGCCGHHAHEHHDGNCQQRTASVSPDHVASCGSCHGCGHDSNAEISLPPSEIALGVDSHSVCDVIVEGDEKQPCQHSHSCNEAHCTFVASTWKSTDFASDAELVISTTCGSSIVDPIAVKVVTLESLLARSSGFVTSLDRCARLQSWQV